MYGARSSRLGVESLRPIAEGLLSRNDMARKTDWERNEGARMKEERKTKCGGVMTAAKGEVDAGRRNT